MPRLFDKVQHFFKDKLAHRLSLYFILIALMSSILAVVITSYIQYQQDIIDIETEVKQVIDAVEGQIANNLWNFDEDSLTLLLEGINRLPVVKGIELRNEAGGGFSIGEPAQMPSIDTALFYGDRIVGNLIVYSNYLLAIEELKSKIIYDSISTALVFVLIGFVFFVIVKKTITDHLSVLSQMTSSPDFYQQKEDFSVTIKRKKRDDELTNLVNALNNGLKKSKELAETRSVYEAQLHKQAFLDDLTSLPNRRDADQYIAQKIKQVMALKKPECLMVFFIDLDGFKEVNDSLGHRIGDNILLDSSKRFSSVIRQNNGYIARFGGDEFIGCVQCKSYEQGELIAKSMIEQANRQFAVENMSLTLSCSMGVVFCPEHSLSSEDVIRKADVAMYRAKALGRNGYVVYDDEIMRDVLLNNSIKQRIKKALNKQDALEIYYQPLINIKEKTIVGFEALIRWEDELLGSVSPEVFVPIAEKTGLIFDIDTMVFEHAIQQVKVWRKHFEEDYKVSINFSPTNFENNRISHWLDGSISQQNALDWVELEVTERLMLADEVFVKDQLKKITQSGVSFSLDDFGTGFSSLGYIKKFNDVLSKIKIDRFFVNELMHSEADLALVKSIITMAESLGIQWLAEGVETKEQIDKLAGLGCEYVQGFYFAKPMPATKTQEFINQWREDYA